MGIGRRLVTRLAVCARFAAAAAMAAAAASAAAASETAALRSEDKAAFTVLSVRDGLINASVSGIVQDAQGFLWFSTQGGLCRYDGLSFKTYENEPFNENSISGNLIQTMYPDSGGVLWLGTYNGLNRFDMATERVTRYRYAAEAADSLSNDLVIAVARDARGALWAGTLNGLNRLDEEKGTFRRYFHDGGDPHSLPNNIVRSLHLDSRGQLWVGTTGGGLSCYDYENDRFDVYPRAGTGDRAPPPSASLQCIAEDAEGVLWLGAWGTGLVRFDPRDGSSETYSLPDNRIYVINAQSRGTIRAGTWGGGLYVLDTASGQVSSFKSSRAVGSLPNDVVYSILQDASGELWVGTNGGGVARMDSTRGSFTAYVADPSDPDALPSGKIIASLVDSRGTLWVSVYSAGVHALEPGSSRWRHFRKVEGDPGSLADDTCNYLYEDSGGRLWVASNAGLSLYDPAARAFSTMRRDPARPDRSLGSDIIYALLEDPKGNLWIGTYTTGLDYWDRVAGTFTHYAFDPAEPGSLSDNLVNSLAYDAQGRLWIGTNNGLNRFEGGRFVRYHYDASRKDGISSNSIQRILRDSRGALWIATRGGGVMRYRPETDSFTHFMRRDGLPDNVAYSVLEDKSGDLWIVTQTGIARFDRETGAIKRVSLYSELENAAFNAGSSVGPKGEIYFGSVGIVTKFDPRLYKVNSHVPPVFVTEFLAANRPKIAVPVSKAPRPFRLADWENSVEFRFAALDYRDPEANQFAYKLEGFDRDWTYAGNRAYASYTNLPSGGYTFRVRAANNDGVWNEEGAAIPLSVAASPFLSWPALLVYLLAIALIGYGLATVRSKRALAAKVGELTAARDALRSADEESRRLAEEADRANRAKSAFIATISHELRTPMNGVIGMSELLSRTDLEPRQRECVDTIRSSGETLLKIINEVLDFSKIEAGRVELEDIPFDLGRLVEKARAAFAPQAESKGLSISAIVRPGLPGFLLGDPLRLGQVLSNLVGNAVKFTDKGGVAIRVSREEGDGALPRVRFEIADTGIGISPESLPTLFLPFSQADQSTTRRYGGTGLGLSISKNFIELMGGRLEVRSTVGSGSTFSFSLPLREAEAPGGGSSAEPGAPYARPARGKPSAAARPEAGNGGRGDRSLAGLRVLVVDDDPVNRLVACRFLAELGAQTGEAESGHEAIVELSKNRYEAVLMDCMMPGMDGFETTLRLRDPASGAKNPTIAVIAMTAKTQAEDRERCRVSGMDGFIAKPISIRALDEEVRRVLERGATARGDAAPAAAAPAFDESSFDERYAGDPAMGDEVLGLFLRQARPLVEEARARLRAGDLEGFGAAMHRLKGSAGVIGGHRTSEAAEEAMAAARGGAGPERLEVAAAAVDAELAALEERILAWLSARGRDGA